LDAQQHPVCCTPVVHAVCLLLFTHWAQSAAQAIHPVTSVPTQQQRPHSSHGSKQTNLLLHTTVCGDVPFLFGGNEQETHPYVTLLT